jgi:hypothetical protein
MTRQTTVLACVSQKILSWRWLTGILRTKFNELARAWLRKFDGENKIPIDPIATLSEHHVSDIDNGYVTLDCFIFMDSFGARHLATKGNCNAMQDDDWNYMEMSKSSCALWTMTLQMANLHIIWEFAPKRYP